MKIVYNANGKEEVVALEDPESSTLFSSGAPKKRKLNRFGLIYVFFMRKASSQLAKNFKGLLFKRFAVFGGCYPVFGFESVYKIRNALYSYLVATFFYGKR